MTKRRVLFERRRRCFEAEGRVTCPCCGYPTIPARSVFEICPLCSWEDDGQDDAAFRPRGAPRIGPDVVVGGVNHDYSLTEARANFARDLTAFRPSDIDFVATRMSARVRREIVRAYDRAVDGLTDIERAEDDARYFFARLHGA